MEERQGKRSSKVSIMRGLNPTVSPINIQMDNHLVIGETGHYHQETNSISPTILDHYAENIDRSSPIMRYFRSRSPKVGMLPPVGDTFSTPVTDAINATYRSAIMKHYASSSSGSNSFGSWGEGSSLSPLSAIENLETPPVRSPQIYGSTVKVDEEVIVMDGILINSVLGGAKTLRSASDSSSGGGSSSGKNQYKTNICRSWEDSGNCRFSHKCQFAHGKEELRPARLPAKTKPKFGEQHYTHGLKFRNSRSVTGIAATTTTTTTLSNSIDTINKTEVSRINGDSILDLNTKPTPISSIPINDWSPEDDGILSVVPNSEDVNQHINSVLYGSTAETTRNRLPVFVQLSSENPQPEE